MVCKQPANFADNPADPCPPLAELSCLVTTHASTSAQTSSRARYNVTANAKMRGRNSPKRFANGLQKEQGLQQLTQEQLCRQRKADERAKAARDSNQRKLREIGCESALDYGQKLFNISVDFVADYISATVEDFLLHPQKARPHASVLPFFDDFDSTHHIAAVALTAALNQLSRRQTYGTFLQHLGSAIEKETRLIKLGKKSPLEMRKLIRDGVSRRKISSKKVLRALHCPVIEWSDLTRLQVGAFLAEAIFATELLAPVMLYKAKRQQRIVVPTEQAETFIRNCKAKAYKPNHLSMLVPPRDWVGLYGGGALENDQPLVKPVLYDAAEAWALDHYKTADLTRTIKGINHLQSHGFRVSAEIVAVQRPTWEGGFEGLWPCSRNPMEIPDRLGDNPSAADLKVRNQAAAAAHRDRECRRHTRIRVERSLQNSEDVVDREVFQAWYLDHRGRCYTSNAIGSTMGPGHEKATLSFSKQLPVNSDAMGWLLKAAAGHHGMSRDTWEARLKWGQDNVDLMVAAAEDPLGKLELWRGAKDPWPFLQMCIGIRDAKATGMSGAMIRLDQTTSGPGILAALTRNKDVGRLCNLFGDSPQDLYSVIAEACNKRLREDLELGDQKKKALAELWLKFGVDRSLVKPGVLRAPYGGSYFALADQLVDALEARLGYVPLEQYIFRISIPSKYMASVIWAEMKEVIGPVMEVKAWLRACCKKLLNKGVVMEWSSPSGWPMRVADREPTNRAIPTNLFGKKCYVRIEDQPNEAPLSSTQANKSISANTVHSFDSAMVHKILYRAAEASVAIVPTHDAFATHPATAGQMHEMLLWEFGNMFRKPLLQQMKAEIEDRTGVLLPEPPNHGTLDPMAIGSNPYLFS